MNEAPFDPANIPNIDFTSAAQLRQNYPRRIVDIIAHHHGYQAGQQMHISKVKSGGYRLFVRTGSGMDSKWMDASLQDIDFNQSPPNTAGE